MLRRRGRGGRSGESRGVCGVGSLGAGLRRGAAERSRGAGPAFPPCCWLRGTAVKSMHLFPGCGARNGVRPICSLRGTAPRPPAGGFFLQPLLPAEAVPWGGESRMGPATPPADSHGGRTSGGRGSVRAPGGGAGVRAAECAAGDGSPHRAPCGRQGSSSPLAAAAAAHPRTRPAARKRRREGAVRSLAVCSSLGFRSDRDPATSPVDGDGACGREPAASHRSRAEHCVHPASAHHRAA